MFFTFTRRTRIITDRTMSMMFFNGNGLFSSAGSGFAAVSVGTVCFCVGSVSGFRVGVVSVFREDEEEL